MRRRPSLDALLDYRCHAPGGEIGKNYPPRVAKCMSTIAAMSFGQLTRHYDLPNERTAKVKHSSTIDTITTVSICRFFARLAEGTSQPLHLRHSRQRLRPCFFWDLKELWRNPIHKSIRTSGTHHAVGSMVERSVKPYEVRPRTVKTASWGVCGQDFSSDLADHLHSANSLTHNNVNTYIVVQQLWSQKKQQNSSFSAFERCLCICRPLSHFSLHNYLLPVNLSVSPLKYPEFFEKSLSQGELQMTHHFFSLL